MRTFSQKQNQPQRPVPASLAQSNRATLGLAQREPPTPYCSQTSSRRFGHNFSQIPIHPLPTGALQTKLAINQLGDQYEQEAERVSAQVMRTAEPTPLAPSYGAPATLQRKCAECARGEGLCPKCAEQAQKALRAPGQPLDSATRAFMEPRFGHDFSHVRIHTDEHAAMSAQALNAHAYTVGSDIVFDRGRFDARGAEGRQLLAHELTHVIQQTAGYAPQAVARQTADTEKESQKVAPKTAPKPAKCHTGCAQRWGQDTTCSKWGFFQGVAERGEGKKWRSISCCNSWPLSVEHYARTQLGLSGAASCTAQHEREIATVSFGEKEVEVLCSDTIPNSMFGETTKASDCAGSISTEVIEMSPKAMQDLSGQLKSALHVKVCYSGSKEQLCLHNGPGAKSFPTINQCLTKGCTPWEGTPTTHKDSGWPRV